MADEPAWRVPRPVSTCAVPLDDGTVTLLRRHGNAEGRRLILGHGNGLAIDAYLPFWSLLADDFDLILLDLRNHGRNPLGPIEQHNVPMLVGDLCRILDAVDARYGEKPRTGVFHSLSALLALLAVSPDFAERIGGGRPAFAELVLFDPPLFRPNVSDVRFEEIAQRLARRIRKRSDRFRGVGDYAELLRYSPDFARLVPGVHELIARTTLRKADDGVYVLRCPPAYEARIIEYARSYGGLVDLAALPCPVKVIGADPTLPFAYLPAFDLDHLDTVDYDFLPGATHYLQFEMPTECVAAMRRYLDSRAAPVPGTGPRPRDGRA